jgi:hypothetical protein
MAAAADDMPSAARPPREARTPPPPAASAPPPARSAPEAPSDLTHVVQEIRNELAQITARELELRRRERELGRRYRSLREATRQATTPGTEDTQQHLARLAAELNAQAVEIAARQARIDDVATQLRAQQVAFDRQRTTPPVPIRPPAPPPPRPSRRRLRAAGLATATALCAGLAWWVGHPPTYHATARIEVVTESPALAEVAAAHRAQLLDPHLLDVLPSETNLAPAWSAACEDGRVTARAADGDSVLWLCVVAGDPTSARRLIVAACTAYSQRLQVEHYGAGLPPRYRELILQRERLEATLQSLRPQRAADEAALATLPALPERSEVSAAVDQLEAGLMEVATALDQQRAELAAIVALEVPRGTVDPTQVDQTLAQDTIYREDQQEFRAAALQYRTELAVALLQLDEPGKAVQKALAQLAASLQEQRMLEPPPDVAAVLDDASASVSAAQAGFAAFVTQWRAGQEELQKAGPAEDVAALVAQQSTMADAARRAADGSLALVNQVGARIEELSGGGDGSTRRVVVAAVLRADHDALKAATESFGAAAAKTALTENFKLDAQDRKLRGLRMRLNNRREAVGQQLQLEADRQAREQHTTEVAEIRDQVRQSERRREELVANLVVALRQLRTLDDAARRRDEVAVQGRQRAAEIGWLEARSAEIAQELADAQQEAPAPDRAEIGPPTVETVAPGRVRNTILVGVAAFAAVWLVCALMNPGPLHRRSGAAGVRAT